VINTIFYQNHLEPLRYLLHLRNYLYLVN